MALFSDCIFSSASKNTTIASSNRVGTHTFRFLCFLWLPHSRTINICMTGSLRTTPLRISSIPCTTRVLHGIPLARPGPLPCMNRRSFGALLADNLIARRHLALLAGRTRAHMVHIRLILLLFLLLLLLQGRSATKRRRSLGVTHTATRSNAGPRYTHGIGVPVIEGHIPARQNRRGEVLCSMHQLHE